jgi:hypothetical protein
MSSWFYYETPQQQRPWARGPLPQTRVCQNSEGGIIRLHDGVPIAVRKEESPQLGLHFERSTPYRVTEIKAYLEFEIELAAKDTERLGAVLEMLNNIRKGCWSWYSKSGSWGSESFQVQRSDAFILIWASQQKTLEREFQADMERGRRAIGDIYPEFVQ